MSAIRCDPSWNSPIFGVRVRPRTISRARWRLAEARGVDHRGRRAGRRARRTRRAPRARAARSRARRSAGTRGRAVGAGTARRSRGREHATPLRRSGYWRRSGSSAARVGSRRGSPSPLRVRSAALAVALLAAASGARAGADPAPAEVIVRLQAEGPHAVTECAAAQHRRGRPLAEIARDRSDSLDRLNAELGVRAVRAVFRRFGWTPARRRARVARGARARAARRASGADARGAARGARARARLPPRAAARRRRGGGRGALCGGSARRVGAARAVAVSADLAANDPFLASSGSWGQPYADLWGILRVRAPEAWDLSQGEGILVAVNDTGIDAQHPDLAANLWVNPGEDLDGNGAADPADLNGVDDDANGFIDDLNGFDFANSVDANGDGDFDDPGDVSDRGPVRRLRARHPRGRHDRGGCEQRHRRGRRGAARAAHGGEGIPRERIDARFGARARDGLRGGQRRARDQQQLVVQPALSEQPGARGGAGLCRLARRRRGDVGGQPLRRRGVLQPEAAARQHRGGRDATIAIGPRCSRTSASS